MERKQKRGTFFVLLASLLFSIGGLCVKLIPWSALSINGARNLIGVLVIGLYLLVSRHRLKWNLPVLLGALSTFGTTTLYTVANKLTTAANAIVLQFTAPVFVILFMIFLFHVKPQKLDVLTCGVVLFGVLLFFIDGLRAGNMLGNLVAVLSGVCYAGVFLMNASEKADALSSVFFGQLAAAVIFTPFCLGETDFSPAPMLALFALGALQVGLAYIFLSLGIRTTPPVTASLITGLEPVLNPVWVALFYGECISPTALAGAVIVIGAIVGYNVLKSKRSKASV
ncbi:DMT family transporter [Neglectibacter caecimuris]|uniref:DMT family transporter n=1 Tax=Neglectibacter caecimuris TaxID=3093658 RepID=UPI002AC9BA7A|nr:EamA family transporter [Neglectibacter sp. M00184]